MQKSFIEFKDVFLAQMERQILGLGNEAQFCRDLNRARQEIDLTLQFE